MNVKLTAVLTAVVAFVGCKGAPMSDHPDLPNPLEFSGESREWWDIYSIEYQGDKKITSKVGHLYHKFDARDPRGKYWVQDLTMNYLGFLLPAAEGKAAPNGKESDSLDLRAYRYVPPRVTDGKGDSQPLGLGDLRGGVKRILGVSNVDLVKVLPKAQGTGTGAPAPASGSSSAAQPK